jgi:hypothetical protein
VVLADKAVTERDLVPGVDIFRNGQTGPHGVLVPLPCHPQRHGLFTAQDGIQEGTVCQDCQRRFAVRINGSTERGFVATFSIPEGTAT